MVKDFSKIGKHLAKLQQKNSQCGIKCSKCLSVARIQARRG